MKKSIEFSESEISVLRAVFTELYGGSSKAIISISNHPECELEELSAQIRENIRAKHYIWEFEESEWREIYDFINAVIYGLGPFELEMLTRHTIYEILQTNLRICTSLWGAYGGASWVEKYQSYHPWHCNKNSQDTHKETK